MYKTTNSNFSLQNEGHFNLGPAIEATFEIQEDRIQNIDLRQFKSGLKWNIFSAKRELKVENAIIQWLTSYLQKRPAVVNSMLQLEFLTPFLKDVLGVLQSIPFADTLSYGEVAEALQKPKAARAIGQACGRNPFPLLIPCHRVLGAGKRLGGFSSGGIEVKKELLAFEGAFYRDEERCTR